jgi:hypothetical protein
VRDTYKELAKELAGPLYGDLLRSKEAALALLESDEPNVRLAAIGICDRQWGCGRDPHFIDKCRAIAKADSSITVRVHAIDVLARAFQGTRDSAMLQFLAELIADPAIGDLLRRDACSAMRRVEQGPTHEVLATDLMNFAEDLKRGRAGQSEKKRAP